jgi:hypothetical protein
MTELGTTIRPGPAPATEPRYPSLTATFWMSLLFGPLGFLSADRAAQMAHARGLPTARYWICFLMAWLLGPVLILGIYFGVPAIAERYSCPYLEGSESASLYC